MKVDYIDHMGDDMTVVNAARVSFNKEVSELHQKDHRLIEYLARNNHWTPFSHVQIQMREKVPIFVARQRFKHMVGFTYNEVSRRYVSDEPEFFIPTEWRGRPEGSVKQGSGEPVDKQGYYFMRYSDLLFQAEKVYESMIAGGVAPEQARMVLPQAMYTEYYVTGSLAAWARAYSQRVDSHAQKEIQELALQWGSIIAKIVPVSWTALTTEG